MLRSLWRLLTLKYHDIVRSSFKARLCVFDCVRENENGGGGGLL